MTTRERGWIAALVILAVLALVEWYYIPGHNRLLLELNNAGHLPVFGLLAIAVLHLIKALAPQLRQQPIRAYAWALALAALLGAASESVQYFTARDADLIDLLWDVLGAASFLALYAAVRDPDLLTIRTANLRLRGRLLALTGLLWLVGGWSLLIWSAAFAQRQLQFPVLCDFDSHLSTKFLSRNGVSLERGVTSDAPGFEIRGTRMHFKATDWPGVEVFDVYPDWHDRDSLVLELTVEGDDALRLGLAVYDQDHNHLLEDRFSRGFVVDPGRQHLAVSLGTVLLGPKHRHLDMSRLSGVMIFGDSTVAGKSVLLERLLLK
jgi:VanZ family protein